MKRRIAILGLLSVLFLGARAASAQLVPANEAGVNMGHLHFNVENLDANVAFWTTIGGVKIKAGAGYGVKIPGVLVFLRQGVPTGSTVGSIVNHIGFKVPDVQASVAKWKAAGVKTEPGTRPTQAYIYPPDGLTRIEILEDAAQSAPLVFDHIHFYVASAGSGDAVAEMQAWYAKMFGGKPGKRGQFQSVEIPGVMLLFAKSDTPTVGTKGRSLDHIGFEVAKLEAYAKDQEATGVKFNVPYNKRPENPFSVALFTDPWGTYIELNEGHDFNPPAVPDK